ncbi:MAG: hypothetical protein A2Z16_00305 [Chloroflexi bacterium RBG_16_54_18]|nr:MAG: hypothetical protein A2Z16_00305 [Chloroflexi bacterium RBG_16_54_18]
MFREETDCIQVERIFRPHLDEGLPEYSSGLIGGKDGQAMGCDDSEEAAAAWNLGSAVVRHVNILNQKTVDGFFPGWNETVRWKRTLPTFVNFQSGEL